ncbi:MAG: hypothetical protein RLO17_24630 [Cyclobacteriaceae bacterium]|jgi:hypothetical protein|tara:strand:- start:15771 stop:16277 length:507 start_codon:yes stop_codon:yes gene_type:complete
MKALKIAVGMVMAATLSSCHLDNEPVRPDLAGQVVGTYSGTLTSSFSQTEMPATAEITSINDYQIQVHCYSADLDTTFFLELYPDENMMRVCFADGDFKNQYGHSMSSGHHTMGNMGNWTSWQQHMDAEHSPDDEHFGYFDMSAGIFTYTFDFKGDLNEYSQIFTGKS